MIFMCNANMMPKWRKIYIMITYMLPHIMYGSLSFILTARTFERMEVNGAFKKLKGIFFAMIKRTL